MNEKSKAEQLNEKLSEAMALYEMSVAWVSKQNNRCVWVENPNGYENRYFKYLNGVTYDKADKLARISLLSPNYVEHSYNGGKQTWELNSKEKKELVNLMNKPCSVNKAFTNWQKTLAQYNLDNFAIEYDETFYSTFNKEEYPNAFDINTPMPDYSGL